MEFYTEETARLEKEVEELTRESLSSPLGFAFVTFDNITSSKIVHDDHSRSYLSCFKSSPQQSSLSDSLKPEKWNVSFAPPPGDVKWINLKEKQLSHYIRIVMVYVGLIWIGLFFAFSRPKTIIIFKVIRWKFFDLCFIIYQKNFQG